MTETSLEKHLSAASQALRAAMDENAKLKQQIAHREGMTPERFDDFEQALRQIANWAKAYPLQVFPEPDLVKARALLEAGGITLDAVSASAMRHVIEGVGRIAREALEGRGER